MAANPVVNRWLDLLDRAGWTAVQAAAASVVATVALGLDWKQFATVVGTATAISVCKVVIGQRTGSDETGSLIGTPVIEPAPKG